MSDEEKVEAEAEEPAVEEAEQVPNAGLPSTDPTPPEPTEEELAAAAQEKADAEAAAVEAAESQPEDASVEKKARQPVLVLKDQFDREWPTVESQFPGVEPEFGKEEDGYVELLNVQAPSMAYATSCAPPVQVRTKAERTQHGWDDYQDNSLPPKDEEEGDIEAKPKRRRQQKVSTQA